MCRSPFAEAYLRMKLAGDDGASSGKLETGSAGVMAVVGSDAAEGAKTMAAEFGVDLSDHRARQLSEELLDDTGMVVVMDRSHLNMILSLWHHHRAKVQFLSSFEPNSRGVEKDIADPYRGSARVYRKCFQRICQAVDGLVEVLKQ